MNDAIQSFLDNINVDWQAEICLKLDQIICESISDVEARIQYRKPHYLKNGKYAVVYGTAKNWVSLTIFNTTHIQPPSDQFEASEKGDRITIKIQKDQVVDYDLLASLIKEASDSI